MATAALPNIHATAIVIGTTGILFVGPSGAGKSSAALQCIYEARMRGLSAALVSDDQVLVSEEDGRLIARAPASIAGLIEVRGAGIVRMETVGEAVLHPEPPGGTSAIALEEAGTPFASTPLATIVSCNVCVHDLVRWIVVQPAPLASVTIVPVAPLAWLSNVTVVPGP